MSEYTNNNYNNKNRNDNNYYNNSNSTSQNKYKNPTRNYDLEEDEEYINRRRRYYGLDDDDSDEDFDIDNEDTKANYDTSSKKRPNHKHQVISEIFSYVKILVAAIIIAYVTTHFIIVNAQVPSGSMNNTIMEWDRLVGFRLSYVFSEPQRGDIVIFKYPDNENENYVKRVIGTPGDIVQIKEGHVYVNDELLDEDYIKEPMATNGIEGTYVVPEGHYFMMGDNRNNSLDSRYWTNTYVAKDKILAKVIFRYYDGSNSKISFSMIN